LSTIVAVGVDPVMGAGTATPSGLSQMVVAAPRQSA
jgi:hypothetical protein